MKYRITHRTAYNYEQPVTNCHNLAHLVPRDTPQQQCLGYRVDIDPAPGDRNEREDIFGNRMLYFSIGLPHNRLEVTAVSEVVRNGKGMEPPPGPSTPWQETLHRISNELSAANVDARQYLVDSPLVGVSSEIKRYAAPSFRQRHPVAEVVYDLMSRIHNDFSYDAGFSTVATPLTVVLEHRRGVCQDFAHLAIACLRSHGLPARYVSGYLETEPPPGQQKLLGADASHAWFSAYDPDSGWLDYDPTNNQVPMGRHITTAWGRDYSDVTPLKGVIYGGGVHHQVEVAVDVTAVDENI